MSLLLWLMVVTLAVPARSHHEDSELAELRRSITSLEAQLERAEREESGLDAEIRRTELSLRIQQQKVEESRAELRLARERVGAAEARAGQLKIELAEAEQRLTERLRALYVRSDRNLLRDLLQLEMGDSVVEDVRWLRYFVHRDRSALEEYARVEHSLREQLDVLQVERAQVEQLVVRHSARRDILSRRHAALDRAREILTARRQTMADRTAKLMNKQRKVAALVALLGGREPPGGATILDFKGALEVPVQGQVTRGFGVQLDPRYGTRVPHNGLEISVQAGEDVRTVFPGVVAFAAPFEDFGQTVVVYHSGDVFSLYAGLGDLMVGKGDVLSFSQVLGQATGSIYFEIRQANRPQDPADWLR